MEDMTSALTLDIGSFGIDLPDDWHPMPLTNDGAARSWAHATSVELTDDPEAREFLVGQLNDLRERLRARSDGNLTAAAYVPHPDLGRVACLLYTELIWLDDDDSADSFEAMIRAEENRRRPGETVREQEVWRIDGADRDIVAAFQVMAYREPGEDAGWLEYRARYGVFVHGARQQVYLAFTATDLTAFDDMVRDTEAVVQTLAVELDPGK